MKSDNGSEASRETKRLPQWYEPGKSGNPAGRPRLSAAEKAQRLEQKRLAREIALRQLDVVILTRQHAEVAVNVLGKIIKSTKSDDLTKLKAIGELFDRAFGRPTETSLNVTADAGAASPETVQARLAGFQRLLALRSQQPAPGQTIEGEISNAT